MIEIVFFITAAVILISATMTVTSHNAVHALLYLVVTMLAIALLFFLLGSPFAAALQIIVYAGAIMVLFIFVTMMLHQGEKSLNEEQQLYQIGNSIAVFSMSALLLAELIYVLLTFDSPLLLTAGGDFTVHSIPLKTLGTQLYGPYQLLVVIAAMMLLSALISAIHIARRQTHPSILTPTPTQASKQQDQPL